jgi:hypothetical protein
MSEAAGESVSGVQYRVVVAKGDERVEGPDDAAVVLTVPVEIVRTEGFDATTEFMRGRLKVAGHTGVLFEALSSGDADRALTRLASPS